MPKYKINSLNGRKKKHSILRELVPLLEGILANTPVREIGSGRMIYCAFEPIEPIEIRGFNLEGKHPIKIRAYGNKCFQNLYLYCHKCNFFKVMEYLLKYSERYGTRLKNETPNSR